LQGHDNLAWSVESWIMAQTKQKIITISGMAVIDQQEHRKL